MSERGRGLHRADQLSSWLHSLLRLDSLLRLGLLRLHTDCGYTDYG